MKVEIHNMIVTEVINKLNEQFEKHNFDAAEALVTLESIVASAIVSSYHTDPSICCAATHTFFANVHERVHILLETKPDLETRKDRH